MNCDTIRSELLDGDWDEKRRQRMAELLQHLEACDACRAAMADFDRVRSSLAPAGPEGEPAGGWPAFEDRLAASVGSARPRRAVMPAALAASILLAVAGWGMYLQSGVHAPGGMATPDQRMAGMALTAEEIADRVQVFDQVWEAFDRRAGWVLIADRASDLGLGVVPGEAIGKLLLLRLSVSRGDSLFSTADLVIVPGQVAQLTIPSERGATLHYRIATSAEDPSRLQLRVEVERENGQREPMGALASDLRLQPGQVTSAGRIVTALGRYDVSVGVYRADMPAERS